MPRDYAKEYRSFHAKPEEIAKRSSRNQARRKLEAELGKSALNGKDVGHQDGNPLNNSRKNLKPESPSKNRGKK